MKSKEAKARIKFNKLLEDMFIYGELLSTGYIKNDISTACVHRAAITQREQAPAAAGAIFLQATGPGGSVPFYGREV